MAVVTINGEVATHWFFRPAGEVLERLEWKTEIFKSFDGKEQRRSLRLTPRRFYEFDCLFSNAERRYAENILNQGQGKLLALPMWMDAQPLTTALSAGTTAIPVTPATRDFRIGSYMGFAGAGGGAASSGVLNEAMNITALPGGTSITVGAPGLGSAWPIGTLTFPIRGARMTASTALQRFTSEVSYGRFQFECTEPNSWTAATGETAYRSIPVQTTFSNWVEDPVQGFDRDVRRVDGEIGLRFFDDINGPDWVQSHRWTLDGRTAIDNYRRWLYARHGRTFHFWLPTFAADMIVVADIGSSATTIDIEHCGYVANIAQDINRRDIRLENTAGTAFHRRITASTVISPTVERITIDTSLGTAVAAADVKLVSYMALARLDTDIVEIAWSRFDVAESVVRMRSSRNDL